MDEDHYEGKELELFQHATVWKNYYGSFIKSYLKGRVLEVGAGLGSTTQTLCDGSQEEWRCLEPDSKLFNTLERKIARGQLPECCTAMKGTVQSIPPGTSFNVILYIDVIEHIEKDDEELKKVVSLLPKGGCLIVLVPAHQFLFSSFDRAIGHKRRYTKKMLRLVAPKELNPISFRYLDSMGLLASLSNKIVLKQQYPTLKQVLFWDRFIVPVSKVSDIITGYKIGKSLVAIWQKK